MVCSQRYVPVENEEASKRLVQIRIRKEGISTMLVCTRNSLEPSLEVRFGQVKALSVTQFRGARAGRAEYVEWSAKWCLRKGSTKTERHHELFDVRQEKAVYRETKFALASDGTLTEGWSLAKASNVLLHSPMTIV